MVQRLQPVSPLANRRHLVEHVSVEPDWESVMIDATNRPCPPTWIGSKKGGLKQAIGRSRGGLTTKIHAVVDALGDPLRFKLTGGQCHDSVTGYKMLKQMDLTKKQMLADRAYDTNQILHLLEQQSATPVIPSKKNRRKPRKWDKEIYKERHLIECFFNKVKHYRQLATRFDKLASLFKAFLTLASIMIWLA